MALTIKDFWTKLEEDVNEGKLFLFIEVPRGKFRYWINKKWDYQIHMETPSQEDWINNYMSGEGNLGLDYGLKLRSLPLLSIIGVDIRKVFQAEMQNYETLKYPKGHPQAGQLKRRYVYQRLLQQKDNGEDLIQVLKKRHFTERMVVVKNRRYRVGTKKRLKATIDFSALKRQLPKNIEILNIFAEYFVMIGYPVGFSRKPFDDNIWL